MIFDKWKIDNLDTYNVLLAIATNIHTHATYDWFYGPGSQMCYIVGK